MEISLGPFKLHFQGFKKLYKAQVLCSYIIQLSIHNHYSTTYKFIYPKTPGLYFTKFFFYLLQTNNFINYFFLTHTYFQNRKYSLYKVGPHIWRKNLSNSSSKKALNKISSTLGKLFSSGSLVPPFTENTFFFKRCTFCNYHYHYCSL